MVLMFTDIGKIKFRILKNFIRNSTYQIKQITREKPLKTDERFVSFGFENLRCKNSLRVLFF